ncbi:IucA/IucC family protein [Streptomyces sp. NPDC018031]|uniref:IucA/IucC family protein n=1 Tax=Streptomyces sp. NPDC018031 TaxID=3365033 RepID=UPI003794553D
MSERHTVPGPRPQPPPRGAPDAPPGPDAEERELLRRVVTTLLREDAYGLRSRSRPVHRPDGDWLRTPLDGAGHLLLPVGPDGFLSELALRRPLLEHHPADGTPAARLTTLDAVLAVLRPAAGPDDQDRYATFAAECRAELEAARHRTRLRPGVLARLAAVYGDRPAAQWTGLAGALAHDTLAAFRGHPVHPTSRARHALAPNRQDPYAPETHPVFPLRWIALPRDAVAGHPGRLPAWWPTPGLLGLPVPDRGHLAVPVHPLTADRALPEALAATGLTAAPLADPARHPGPRVRPTLSMRTVAVVHDLAVHLKLPLPTATLGALNRRTIKPGTLTDGAVAQRLLEAVLSREPALARTLLFADETTHLHAGHELLAVLVRRYPAGLDGCRVVPVAALPAAGPTGQPVAQALAEHFYGGDLTAFLDAYLTVLFAVHTTLFGYGIALESHQQNTSVVLDRTGDGRPRLRLLVKDHDGPRVHPGRLAAALGRDGPRQAADLCRFDDPRILVDDDGPAADVFTTITVHLCAAAPLFELAALGTLPRPAAAALLRHRLAEAVDRLGTAPGTPGAVLRARLLEADRLPVKAMVTAGTLYSKRRSGAADINKHYTSGPNYLRQAAP